MGPIGFYENWSKAAADLTRSGAWLVGSVGVWRLLDLVGSAGAAVFEQEAELFVSLGEWMKRNDDDGDGGGS
jgi:hypothetical protein